MIPFNNWELTVLNAAAVNNNVNVPELTLHTHLGKHCMALLMCFLLIRFVALLLFSILLHLEKIVFDIPYQHYIQHMHNTVATLYLMPFI